MQNVKEVLQVVLSMLMSVEKAKVDGKIDFADVAHFADPLMKLPGAIMDAGLVLAEFKAATVEQRAALMAELSVEFDLADDALEAKVEAGLEWLMASGKFFGTLKV